MKLIEITIKFRETTAKTLKSYKETVLQQS